MKKLLLAIVLLVVIVGGGLAVVNVAFDHTKVKTHAVTQPVREIVVKSSSGDVDLVPGGKRIEVRETQHYVFKKPKFEQDVKNGVLTLDSDCDGSVFECYADLRVPVPAGVEVTVEADSGDVDAHGIDVRNAHVQSDSGDLRLELPGRQSLVWAHTDSGDVDAAVDARAVDAQTDSGDVAVDAGRDVRRIVARTDSGDVTVSVPRGDYAVDAGTDSGDVTIDGITRNDGAQKSIQARTDSGDVMLRGR
jgi:hypothetical protein